ncbi:MAG TPA: class I SAM-dependent methyltransferase [Blastocatellia bacterium]|jgi:ubiquinone/menaquinone biosynthesis C-methylase UbiE
MHDDSRNKNSADAYDDWHREIHGDENPAAVSLQDWHRNALSLSPSQNSLAVLEVGCGVGDFAIHLAGQGAKVTAVDFSPQAIELARAKSEAQNRPVNFQVADAQSLPFEDGSFDVVFSCECLEHVPDPRLALTEFYRVLKPLGKLVLTTENYSNAMLLGWLVCWLRKEPFNSGAGVQPVEHFFLFWRVKHMFKGAGFQVQRMIGSHHVFLMLPRFDPSTFVVERFDNPIAGALLRPFARHMAFAAVKK